MTDSVPIVVYLLLVLTGVIEVSLLKQKPIHRLLKPNQISISAWILVQWAYNQNYPSETAKTGIELILFVAPISCDGSSANSLQIR